MTAVDRAALVQALMSAAEADGFLVTRYEYDERDAMRDLDAVLPLIADAIEKQMDDPGASPIGRAWLGFAARLVRGLANSGEAGGYCGGGGTVVNGQSMLSGGTDGR